MSELKCFFWHPLRFMITRVCLIFFFYPCKGKVIGEEIITSKKETGFLIISNHQSYLDWLILWAYFQQRHKINVTFLAKEYLFKHWLWGKIVSSSCCVKASNSADKILSRDGFKRLVNDKYIVIFPEGTRSKDGSLLPFHQGATRLAQKSNKEIIPIALDGFYDSWPPSRKYPKASPCRIIIGHPVTIEKNESIDNITESLQRTIQRMISNAKSA